MAYAPWGRWVVCGWRQSTSSMALLITSTIATAKRPFRAGSEAAANPESSFVPLLDVCRDVDDEAAGRPLDVNLELAAAAQAAPERDRARGLTHDGVAAPRIAWRPDLPG